ncbi:helix-turn-helix domain-containing protein [Rhodopseudomonas palustris]|nr:helix-turn-helix transcriptional regulator [Rhodopseudomonas palustris]
MKCRVIVSLKNFIKIKNYIEKYERRAIFSERCASEKGLIMSKGMKNNGFAGRLRATREARSMSASDLAKLLDVTPTAVWNWEKNDVVPRPDMLSSIAQVLGVTKEFLQNGEEVSSCLKTVSLEAMPLEDLMKAIEAKGFNVSVSPKSI